MCMILPYRIIRFESKKYDEITGLGNTYLLQTTVNFRKKIAEMLVFGRI